MTLRVLCSPFVPATCNYLLLLNTAYVIGTRISSSVNVYFLSEAQIKMSLSMEKLSWLQLLFQCCPGPLPLLQYMPLYFIVCLHICHPWGHLCFPYQSQSGSAFSAHTQDHIPAVNADLKWSSILANPISPILYNFPFSSINFFLNSSPCSSHSGLFDCRSDTPNFLHCI